MQQKKKISKIYTFHYIKLILRLILFLTVFAFYILGKTELLMQNRIFPMIVWVFFIVGMAMRFFPAKLESVGCQKQFKRNYEPVGENIKPVNQSWKRTALAAGAWFALNTVVGALYFTGIIDKGMLVVIALAYSICDIICILFFCPFQMWFMKNRCCTTCRIYNWDFAMLFTPFVFIPHWYTYSLLGCALLLLLRWEVTFRLHPERFSAATNKCLDCSRCEEKLCSHKKQLRSFIKNNKARFFQNSSNGVKK